MEINEEMINQEKYTCNLTEGTIEEEKRRVAVDEFEYRVNWVRPIQSHYFQLKCQKKSIMNTVMVREQFKTRN